MTKISLLWLGTFFQLVLLVADDMRRVPQEYIETGLTLGAKPRQVLTDVAFRAMLPNMVDSLRITLGWCWTYLIIAEIVAANSGIGYVIWAARRYVQDPRGVRRHRRHRRHRPRSPTSCSASCTAACSGIC